MKKKDIFLVVTLMIFGFIYYSIHNVDYGFLKEGNFSFESTRLASGYFNEFQQKTDVYHNIKKIVINNRAGSVFVEKSDNNDVICQVYARIYYQNKNKAETVWNSISVLKEVNENELNIYVKSSFRFPYNRVRIYFFLKVPNQVSLAIKNSLGDIGVVGTGNDIQVKEDFGNVKITNVQGSVEIDSIYGNVFAKDIKGGLRLKSQFSQVLCEKINAIESESKYGVTVLKEISERSHLVLHAGNLSVESSKNVEIQARNTTIIVKSIYDYLKIKDSNERIDLENINGNINIDATNCKIALKDCISDNLGISDTNESVMIERFTGGNVSLNLKHGGLAFNFLKIRGSVNIHANYSNIGISFPYSIKPFFYVKNEFGSIENMSSITIHPMADKAQSQMIEDEKSPYIFIDSVYGTISIKNR